MELLFPKVAPDFPEFWGMDEVPVLPSAVADLPRHLPDALVLHLPPRFWASKNRAFFFSEASLSDRFLEMMMIWQRFSLVEFSPNDEKTTSMLSNDAMSEVDFIAS